MHGAGHEAGRRAGTENVLLDVGLGIACELAAADLEPCRARLAQLRDYLQSGLKDLFGDLLHLNGHPAERLPNTLNISFAGHLGGEVLEALDSVAASTGSACHSGRRELSPVLKAMSVPENIGLGAVRFSLGRWTTAAELDQVLALFKSHILTGNRDERIR
jgi:cysteine desulfurase